MNLSGKVQDWRQKNSNFQVGRSGAHSSWKCQDTLAGHAAVPGKAF